jgi:hypothetical protein
MVFPPHHRVGEPRGSRSPPPLHGRRPAASGATRRGHEREGVAAGGLGFCPRSPWGGDTRSGWEGVVNSDTVGNLYIHVVFLHSFEPKCFGQSVIRWKYARFGQFLSQYYTSTFVTWLWINTSSAYFSALNKPRWDTITIYYLNSMSFFSLHELVFCSLSVTLIVLSV